MRPSRALLTAVMALILPLQGVRSDARQRSGDDGLKIDFDMTYYDVSGGTWFEIAKSIIANRRQLSTGERFEGVTRYEVTLKPADASCTASNATLEVALEISMPQLTEGTTLDQADQACWAAYGRSLSDHEEFHVLIAKRGARELLEAIRGSRNASCADLKRLVTRHVQALRKTQADYDRISRHGLRQWKAWRLSGPADPEAQALQDSCAERAALG